MTAGEYLKFLKTSSAYFLCFRQALPDSADSIPFVSDLNYDEVGPDVVTSSEGEGSDADQVDEGEISGEKDMSPDKKSGSTSASPAAASE